MVEVRVKSLLGFSVGVLGDPDAEVNATGSLKASKTQDARREMSFPTSYGPKAQEAIDAALKLLDCYLEYFNWRRGDKQVRILPLPPGTTLILPPVYRRPRPLNSPCSCPRLLARRLYRLRRVKPTAMQSRRGLVIWLTALGDIRSGPRGRSSRRERTVSSL